MRPLGQAGDERIILPEFPRIAKNVKYNERN
jgi:hypothetical protein